MERGAMSDDRFDLHSIEIKKLLRSYGQDLATHGAKGQPFGAPEVGMALILIMGWFLKTILKVIIEHEVKKRLEKELNDRKLSNLDAGLRKLESVVDQVLRREISVSMANDELRRSYAELTQRFEALEEPDFTFTKEHIDDLLEVLQSVGLTRRRAFKLSMKITDVSVQFLNKHIERTGNADP